MKPGSTPVPPGWRPSVPYRDDRLWRGSRIAPYGANLAAVLYRARGGAGNRSVWGQGGRAGSLFWQLMPMGLRRHGLHDFLYASKASMRGLGMQATDTIKPLQVLAQGPLDLQRTSHHGARLLSVWTRP